ncbi:hypothetical protein HWB90_gp085 [Mycobacterium phage Fowlmouth]|uniref:Uncharacterized protein n=1 Tax=Mycobacterium phage Fowlmouth TaxID=2419978 RepID=A0A3G2KGE1_9CAUD|nr:hypothetical protein HWB90_gp085 [Mycobacterium phage Fowlmouth]AYN58054.1 hypothetical protein SEA_FOWLMOUTH_105 [Mycobacterium phage Fowlmouth]
MRVEVYVESNEIGEIRVEISSEKASSPMHLVEIATQAVEAEVNRINALNYGG